jgi:2-methylcitrate dehydratase PrpD
MAAFNIGAMLCCVDLAAILAVADYLARRAHNDGRAPLCVHDLLTALVKARALHAMLQDTPQAATAALAATTAVVAQMLGGGTRQIAAAVDSAWTHGGRREHAAGVGDGRRIATAAGCVVHWAWVAVHRGEPASPGAPVSRQRSSGAAFAGHRMRSASDPLQAKFVASVTAHFVPTQAALILGRFAACAALVATPVNEFMATLVKNG